MTTSSRGLRSPFMRSVLVAGLIVLAACGGSDDAGSTTTTGAPATTVAATTTAATTTTTEVAETTTTDAPTTTVEETTTTEAKTTTTLDPLTVEMRKAGYGPPSAEIREAIETYCDAFEQGDEYGMDSARDADDSFKALLRAGFRALCPEFVDEVGSN